jgi:hypothetical protein
MKHVIQVVNMRNCVPPWGRQGDVRIDRGTPFGNPFLMKEDNILTRKLVIEAYEKWVIEKLSTGELSLDMFKNAKRLGCWCKPKPCHGDVLKRLIERGR